MARKRVTIEEVVAEETVEVVQETPVVEETTPKKRRTKKQEPTVVEEPAVEAVEESTPNKTKVKKSEPVVVVEETPVVEEPVSKNKKIKKEEPVAETTEIPVPKRRKKLSPDKIVEEAIKKNNIPVYDEEPVVVKSNKVEKEKIKKKQKVTRKQLAHAKRQHQLLIEKKVVDGDNAAYVQIVRDKKRTKKIIRYNTDINTGLSSEIVEHRKLQNLCNTKNVGSTKTIPSIILGNIFTFFNLLNFAIAAWIISVKGWGAWKYIFFVVIVTANIVISIVQEIRSKKIIDKLSILSAPNAVILRDGQVYDIPVSEVVLDDILYLSSGNQISSDSILIEGGIEVNESLLTGESDAITKKAGDILYAGSFVVSGNCKARVERIGKDNYIEKLTSQAKKYRKPKSDLLKTLTTLIRVLAVIIVPLGILVFMSQNQGLVFEGPIYENAVIKTSGAVIGMIPSGLFLLTSIALAVGVIRLAQNNTLVQELYCIEMLARVDVLCLDKTGTITDGTMYVKDVIEYNSKTGLSVKNIYSAMQNVLEDTNVTSRALEEKFGRAKKIKHKNFIPFNSARKYSAVEFEKYGTFVLGAPEFVLTNNFNLIEEDVKEAASNGYRVLCLAHSNGSIVDTKIEGHLAPVALILIEDTIRPDAIETIEYFKNSGVEVKVISGDNPLTVSKISQRAGIENAEQYISLEGLTDKEVERIAHKYTVFGRVSPSQKKILITTLKKLGKTVAMTGDGVNDILALRESDCSISLGSGSDAARNVSHLVLLDSNFSSMPKVVAEGRRVINNVQRVASLFLTKTIFSLLLAVYCILSFEHQYPIQTNQLIIIDLCVTGIPSTILALEPNNSKVIGKFIVNVIKNALPGALAIAITTALVFLFENAGIIIPDGEQGERVRTTIIVANATFTCFTVLFKVCKPFNVLRRVLFFFMATLAVCLFLFTPNMFDIVQILPFKLSYLPDSYYESRMRVEEFLFMLCMMQATYPLIIFLSNFKDMIKKLAQYFVNLLRKIKY